MTFEYHIEKINQYVPINTIEGRELARLILADVEAIKIYLNDLVGEIRCDEYKEEILNYINEGVTLNDELYENLSKITPDRDRTLFLLELIVEQYREAKRLIAFKEEY